LRVGYPLEVAHDCLGIERRTVVEGHVRAELERIGAAVGLISQLSARKGWKAPFYPAHECVVDAAQRDAELGAGINVGSMPDTGSVSP